MFPSRSRQRDSRADIPDYVRYAAYLYRTPVAFRMYLRSVSWEVLLSWYEDYLLALPQAHAQVLAAEVRFRRDRPHTHQGCAHAWA